MRWYAPWLCNCWHGYIIAPWVVLGSYAARLCRYLFLNTKFDTFGLKALIVDKRW
jgi:hypothetical protein